MLKVLQPGIFTSIQDLGRFGYMKYGVPVSGVMDRFSATKANLLLNNHPNCSIIECTQSGPKLLFKKPTKIAIYGADMSATINDVPATLNTTITIKAGDILKFGKLTYGYRTYVAVKDGFQTEEVLRSQSFYKPITKSSVLLKDEEIAYKACSNSKEKPNSSISIDRQHFSNSNIEVYKGPEYELLNKLQRDFLFSTNFHVAMNNRMAYQLKELLSNNLPSIFTSSILPGTIQFTPSGKLIILMRDAQTTGGYPRILNLTENAINQLSQKRLGDVIRFQLIA